MRVPASLETLALASLSAILACAEPAPTESSPVPAGLNSGPVSALSGAPEISGPIVVRGSSGFFFFVFDAPRGLFAIHIARNGFGFCGEPFTIFRPGQFQQVQNPVDELLVQQLFQAEAFVTIYAWAGQDILETDDILCDFLLNSPKIAQGTAHLVETDNALFGSPGTRVNAFGFTAEGVVELTGGGKAHYSAYWRFAGRTVEDLKGTEAIILHPLP